jgi:hypothetical protein
MDRNQNDEMSNLEALMGLVEARFRWLSRRIKPALAGDLLSVGVMVTQRNGRWL